MVERSSFHLFYGTVLILFVFQPFCTFNTVSAFFLSSPLQRPSTTTYASSKCQWSTSTDDAFPDPAVLGLQNEKDRSNRNDLIVSLDGSRHGNNNDCDILRAYSYNLHARQQKQQQMEKSMISKDYLLKPARSLAYFLMENTRHEDTCVDLQNKMAETLQRAVIQAIQISASTNDYKLILRLVEAVQNFAGKSQVFDPSILGFAISGLSSTSVNIGKIKHVWKDLASSPLLTRPIGPLELNAYMQALVQHKKIRAALDLYKTSNATDAYSVSIVLNALKTSIQDQQPLISNDDELLSPPPNNSRHLAYFYSDCWQWNEALDIMEDIQTNREFTKLNNAVFTALLRLNERASSVFHEHDLTERVIMILELMKTCRISPDERTSTLMLSGLDQEWELALNLLQSYENQTDWSFPKPNIYMFSAAMTVCARSRNYGGTLQLLENMKSYGLIPNVWIFNSILQALCGGKQQDSSVWRIKRGIRSFSRWQAKQRVSLALQLFHQMEVEPDKVTFNTLLAVVAGSTNYMNETDWENCTGLVTDIGQKSIVGTPLSFAQAILDQMEKRNIQSDGVTYKHAIRVVPGGDTEGVQALISRGIGSLKNDFYMDVFEAGLSTFANAGNLHGIFSVLETMEEYKVIPNEKCNEYIINGLGVGNATHLIPFLFERGDDADEAFEESLWRYSIDWKSIKSSVDASLYSEAFSCCVRSGDLVNAQRILKAMQKEKVKPSHISLEAITQSYSLLALGCRPHENELARRRASSAFSLLSSLHYPSAKLLSTVAKACCSAGMFDETHSVLKRIHSAVLKCSLEARFSTNTLRRSNQNILELPRLHRTLLKYCADQGNVTNALRLCEEIQYLARRLKANVRHGKGSWPVENSVLSDSDFGLNRRSNCQYSRSIGMSAEDWTLLITAASKSGHWRVCLTSLQFLQPYLEATKPYRGSADVQRQKYAVLESAFSTAVKCLALRSQYAWIVRLIDDWIQWCGRRPPRDAVLAAIRILSSRGRGEEVNNLLARCTDLPSSKTKLDNASYELMVFVGAITSLYHEGHYDDADDAFVSAVTKNILPFNLERNRSKSRQLITLDLHGMNLAVAHSAVRISLQQLALTCKWDRSDEIDNQLIIVTGRGLNSELRMRPVLRPEVQRMLLEEFYPPLSTTSLPGNMGALLVSSEDISAWIAHQREQKGARMLMIAAMLRHFVSPRGRMFNALLRVADGKESRN